MRAAFAPDLSVINIPYIDGIGALAPAALAASPFCDALQPLLDSVLAAGALPDATAGGAAFQGDTYKVLIERAVAGTSALMAADRVHFQRPLGVADYVAATCDAIAQEQLAHFLASLPLDSVSLDETEAALVARAEGERAAVTGRFDDATGRWAAYEGHGRGAARLHLVESVAVHVAACLAAWRQLEAASLQAALAVLRSWLPSNTSQGTVSGWMRMRGYGWDSHSGGECMGIHSVRALLGQVIQLLEAATAAHRSSSKIVMFRSWLPPDNGQGTVGGWMRMRGFNWDSHSGGECMGIHPMRSMLDLLIAELEGTIAAAV